MKKIITMIIGLLMLCGLMTGCEERFQSEETAYTDQIKEQSLDAVGLPAITRFTEMSQYKSLYELRDDPNLITYWYLQSMDGRLTYQGRAIGFGIPAGVSMTSPDQIERVYRGAYEVISQAEPNGLYTDNVTTSATWILALDEEGNIHPSYIEMPIAVFTEKVETWRLVPGTYPDNY